MSISVRGLNRATLGRQMLLARESLDIGDAVRRVVALQAQQAASPYLALWNRLTNFDPSDLDAAFARHEVVKATLMRVTLHAVHREDYRVFREAMEPTLHAAGFDHRFKASGLTVEDANALIPDLLTFAEQPRTSAEYATWLEQQRGAPLETGAWRGLRGYAPLVHAPTGGPWSFGYRSSYIAARTTPVLANPDVSAESLQSLILRYLEGFGPASVADMAQFATVQRSRVKEAVKTLSGKLERLVGPDGKEYFDIPGGLRPDEDISTPPRLMAMWDSVLLAYSDRSRIIRPEYRALVTRINGDVLPTLLVDGYVVGVWRSVEGGIEATAFHHLPDDVWDDLAVEARALTALLADREPEVYRRYHHWWSKELSGAETRLLPGD